MGWARRRATSSQWMAVVAWPGMISWDRPAQPPDRVTTPGFRLLDVNAKQWSASDAAASITLRDVGYAVTADGVLLMAGTNRFEASGRGTQRFKLNCRQVVPLDPDSSVFLPVTFAPERKAPAESETPSATEADTDWFERGAAWLRHQRIKAREWDSQAMWGPLAILFFVMFLVSPIIRYIFRKRS